MNKLERLIRNQMLGELSGVERKSRQESALQEDRVQIPRHNIKNGIESIYRGYSITIHDGSIPSPFMFTASRDFFDAAENIRRQSHSELELARRIYDWFEQNVRYDKSHLLVTYKNAQEVFSSKRGACGEMAFLYITMARYTGLRSNFVEVTQDFEGRAVAHGCAVVYPGNRALYVDPAYRTFDIHHKRTKILSDKKIADYFAKWRKKDDVQAARSLNEFSWDLPVFLPKL